MFTFQITVYTKCKHPQSALSCIYGTDVMEKSRRKNQNDPEVLNNVNTENI